MVIEEPTLPPGSLFRTDKDESLEGLSIALRQAAYALKSIAESVTEDPHYKSALLKSERNVRDADDLIRSQQAELELLRHRFSMIVSHASGGALQDITLPTNTISVEITKHQNRVWDMAKLEGAKELLVHLKMLPEKTADELVRKFKMERLDLEPEDFQDIAASLADHIKPKHG